jgi:hypothetical protein
MRDREGQKLTRRGTRGKNGEATRLGEFEVGRRKETLDVTSINKTTYTTLICSDYFELHSRRGRGAHMETEDDPDAI